VLLEIVTIRIYIVTSNFASQLLLQ